MTEQKMSPQAIEVRGARVHNLKDIDIDIPLGKLVGIAGVSGSGKSSLINEVLFKRLTRELTNPRVKPGRHEDILGMENVDKVIDINLSLIHI